MTKTTNYEKKRILSHVRGWSVVYMCVSLLSVTKLFSFLFSWIPLIGIFIFLLYLHIDYLNPTFGGLRLHSQYLCLIQNILVNFYLAI